MSETQPVYPVLLPTTDYDLAADAIHSRTRPGLPSVQVPGFKHEYQLASESPGHLWPHNAANVGMIRYCPPADSVQESRRLLGYINDDGDAVFVHFAFLYTHPKLRCDHCAAQGLECVQWYWDGPDQGGKWPNPVTDSLVAYDCVLCYGKQHPCSNRGVHILNSERPAMESGLVKDMNRSREEARRRIRPRHGFKTQFTPRIRSKKSSRKRRGKRTRADLDTDSEHSSAESTHPASPVDAMARLDTHLQAMRDDFQTLAEENRGLKRQVEGVQVELAVQSSRAELAGDALVAAQVKHAEELCNKGQCLQTVMAQVQAAEKERDQARAELGRLQARNTIPAHSTSQASISSPMLRHVQQPTLTDSPDEQVTALKDTIANQQTRLANLQGRLATSLNDKEKLQAQLLTAERRILELESESGWS
ncbi:hypothetical protein EHS25_000667 [Saitozyma podzolica]|uniref:Uncharacterized protein n=1 Tax=Saitozyma podzolica TaxID=1890683 RepID=A0A427YWZ8_9TREE|nr:hypothetical protein EHS25_000667 [Saitozyma podzolica]